MTLVKRLVKGSRLTHAELDGNFDHLMAEIAKVSTPVSPTGVAFSTAPGTPTVTNTGITETASVVDNNGTPVNIPSLLMAYSLAASGKKRRDAIVVDYLAGSPTYVRIAGTEVNSTDVVPTPSIPVNRLFVRYLDISDGAATAYQSELSAVTAALAGKLDKAGGTLDNGNPQGKGYFGPLSSQWILSATGIWANNITRDPATGIWTVGNDAANNGAGIILHSITQGWKIITIPTTGAGVNQTFSDAQLAAMAVSLDPSTKADKDLSINTQTASYTLALTDRGGMVRMNVASANTLTVPPNSAVAFPVGTQLVISQAGAGQTTIVAGSGVTVNSNGSKMKFNGQWSGATLVKVGSDQWTLFGDLTV